MWYSVSFTHKNVFLGIVVFVTVLTLKSLMFCNMRHAQITQWENFNLLIEITKKKKKKKKKKTKKKKRRGGFIKESKEEKDTTISRK